MTEIEQLLHKLKDRFAMDKFLVILDSGRFWKIIAFFLALVFLLIIYNFSENGRYITYKDYGIMDSRTGIVYYPAGPGGKLTPVLPD